MKKAIVLHSVVPVRAEAHETAAQETQLLFAETCTVLEQIDRWIRVKSDTDGQEGWADSKMITLLNRNEWQQVKAACRIARVKMPMAYALSVNNGQTVPLTAGTVLPDYKDGRFELLGAPFQIDPAMVAEQPLEMTEQNVMNAIRFFLNIPYLWGGKNAMGMDCSGFTQVIHSLFGHSLLRNASEQARQGRIVKSLRNAQIGDLAFFDHEDGKISHVGLLLDNGRIVHCSGRVKVEKVDEQGIFSVESGGVYTHHLVAVRRYA
ncbi:MAG: C40 family peptidase [Paludibacteraceae bacterium]|nr:C40 family peptidase [Paludibacteraceae bacterium]